MILASCPHGCTFEVAVLTEADRDRVEAAHNRRHHGDTLPVQQLPTVTGWAEALDAARALAATGREFTVDEIPDVPGHKTNKGLLAREVHRLGIAHPVSYRESKRGPTRASAVKVWHESRERCMDVDCARSTVVAG